MRLRTALAYLALVALSWFSFRALIPVQRQPLGARFLRGWVGGNMEAEQAIQRWFALRDTLRILDQALMRAEYRQLAAQRLPLPAGALVVEADTSIDEENRARVERVARAELALMGRETPASPVRVIVTHAEPGTTVPQYRRFVVLPASAGRPCTVILQALGPRRRIYIQGNDRLLGTCAFFAAFGAPGRGMDRWLRETSLLRAGFLLAPEGVSTARATDPATVNAMVTTPFVGPCRVGRLAACDSLFAGATGLEITSSFQWDRASLDRRFPDASLNTPNTYRGQSAGITYGMLGGLADQLGAERFGQFWRSDDPPREAYQEITSESLTVGIQHFVSSRMSDYEAGPSVTWPQLLAALTLVGIAVFAVLRDPKRAMG